MKQFTAQDCIEVLDRRIREVIAKSNDAKTSGRTEEMYKLNTVFHWLNEVRSEIEGGTKGNNS